MNDTTVWCQSRGVTEPAGEKNPFGQAKKKKTALAVFLFLYI